MVGWGKRSRDRSQFSIVDIETQGLLFIFAQFYQNRSQVVQVGREQRVKRLVVGKG
jgi:hypothetical protein